MGEEMGFRSKLIELVAKHDLIPARIREEKCERGGPTLQ